MRPIICYLADDGITIYTKQEDYKSNDCAMLCITDIQRQHLTYVEEDSPKSDVTELVTLGMTAEDLIKLKHGGVI